MRSSSLTDDDHAALDAPLIEGYTQVPETADNVAETHSALRESIAGEPW